MKRKTITLVVYMLVCISLVSVGFAAWIITGGDTKTTTGNVKATSVTDESVYVEVVGWDLDTNNNGVINFGHPDDDGDSSSWLQYPAGNVQVLETICMFKVSTKASGTTIGATIAKLSSAELVFDDSNIEDLQPHYISEATVEYAISSTVFSSYTSVSWLENDSSELFADLSEQKGATECYVAVKISYQWGSNFGTSADTNPFTYFKDKTPSASSGVVNTDKTDGENTVYYTWKELASKYLTELNDGLTASGTDFTLTFKLLGKGE